MKKYRHKITGHIANYLIQEDLKLQSSKGIARFCPNCNHPNNKEESLNQHVCRYCESESDTNL